MSFLSSPILFLFIILPLPAILIISIVLAARDSKKHMNTKHDAKYTFYYLLSLVALIFMAISVGMVAFGIIDKTIPDILNYYNYSSVDSRLKFAISALLISIPAFYSVSYLINKGLRCQELDKESPIRRWLTYFIILVSSLIILGSFVSLVNSFLSGELTVRFILKVASVLLIAGISFSFYLYDVKRESPEKKDRVTKIFFIATLFLVVSVFVAAWFFVESPQKTRARRIDNLILNNFSNLESSINSYYTYNKKLPEKISDLSLNQQIYFNPEFALDPESKEEIGYNRINDTEFELCAYFRASNREDQNDPRLRLNGNNQEHDSGYQCLSRKLWIENAEAAIEKK